MDWVRTELIWYAGSFTVHLLGLSLLLLMGNFTTEVIIGDAPSFEEVKVEKEQKEATRRSSRSSTSAMPTIPPHPSWTLTRPWRGRAAGPGRGLQRRQPGLRAPAAAAWPPARKDAGMGGAGGFNVIAYGSGPEGRRRRRHRRRPGHRQELGQRRRRHRLRRPRQRPPQGHAGQLRRHQAHRAGRDRRPDLARPAPTPRRQLEPQNYSIRCTDKTCTGAATSHADAGATAMGLLPFLAAGQTHKYQRPVSGHHRQGRSTGSSSTRSPMATWPPAATSRCTPTAWRPSPCARPTA